MATATILGRAAVWGIADSSGDTHAAGIITRMRHAKAGGEDFVYDNDGFTIAQCLFDDQDECEVDVICEAATAMPDRGDSITIAGITAIVQTAELNWEQRGWKSLKIKAKKFVNLV